MYSKIIKNICNTVRSFLFQCTSITENPSSIVVCRNQNWSQSISIMFMFILNYEYSINVKVII